MKYMGSKNRVCNDILPYILNGRNENQWYVEPFCGGCNVIDKVSGLRIANDKNQYLISMFKSLCEGKTFPMQIPKIIYDDVRKSFNDETNVFGDDMKGWVGFMGSFNGRFYDGGYSGHNVKNRDYINEQIRNTLKQIDKLKNIEWRCGEYFDLIIPNNSIIYCDPPYKNTKQYLTSKNFDYEKFYNWCREMKKLGHKIFISEYEMPDDFSLVWEKQITNSMNNTKTYKPIEKLFTL